MDFLVPWHWWWNERMQLECGSWHSEGLHWAQAMASRDLFKWELSRPEDLLEPSTSQFLCECASVCMQADMPQRDCRLSTFSSSKHNVEGCTVSRKLNKWGCASVWQTWLGESWSSITFKRHWCTDPMTLIHCLILPRCTHPNTSAITYYTL